MSQDVLFDITGGIATITLNRPDKLNAIADEMVDTLIGLLGQCASDPDVGAVILTGAGKGFCAGGDVSRMGGESVNNEPVVAKDRLWYRIQRIPMLLSEFDKPVIAAVNGVAAGLGLDLACMCDIRLGAQSARFCASYARIGLVPGGGGGWLLPRIIRPSLALEMLWTAAVIGAERALEMGLVSRLVPDGELASEARVLAERLLNTSPLAVQLIKRSVQQAMDTDLVSHLDQASSHMAIVRSSADHLEAVAAFKEKRPPAFTGR